jgi:outer membrane protein assembly factor BamD
MLRKLVIASLLAASFLVAGCQHKVQNPIANIDSKQPDKVLFDRAMDSMNKARYTEARTLLDTLLTTYPESEYVARAKLAKGDAWYAEGGTAGLQEAEVEYKDFITFFPNLPEAAEAQLKVAEIHYKQMEKPDRDYTQAMRAADEYKTLINQFPDSKLVPQAKQRLREVQEVLAERQWRIAHFYYLRNNLAASEARLTSLMDSYPLYSGADEALFLLGSIYERQATAIRLQKKAISEATREKLAAEYEQKAIAAYSRLITRYPVMFRAEDARRRLQAMKAPVPKPTPEAIAQNQAEEDSRKELTRFQELVDNFRKHPDVAKATDVGEPTMAEEEIDSAPALIQQLTNEVREASAVVGTGPAPGPNQPPPGSATTQPAPSGSSSQPAPASANQPASGTAGGAQPAAANPAAASTESDLPVLPNAGSASAGAANASAANSGSVNASGTNANTANAGAANAGSANAGTATASNATATNASAANPGTANAAGSSASSGNAAAAPKQINDIGATSAGSTQSTTQNAQNGQQQNTNDQQDSSSKKKKKKGLHKLIPF